MYWIYWIYWIYRIYGIYQGYIRRYLLISLNKPLFKNIAWWVFLAIRHILYLCLCISVFPYSTLENIIFDNLGSTSFVYNRMLPKIDKFWKNLHFRTILTLFDNVDKFWQNLQIFTSFTITTSRQHLQFLRCFFFNVTVSFWYRNYWYF